MKSHHDFDSTVYLKSLGSTRKRFSIPSEYVLHAPRSEQRPYHPCLEGFGISIDALEAGLRFPLHPVIGECLNWWRVSPGQIASNSWCYIITFLKECKGSGIVPSQDLFLSCFRLCMGHGGYYLTARSGFRVGGAPSNNKVQLLAVCLVLLFEMVSMSLMPGNPRAGGGASWNCTLGSNSSTVASVDPARRSGSASDVQEIPIEEARGALKASRKRRGGDSIGQKKKDRCKSPHKADRATKGKGPADTSDEPPAPRQRPKSVRELCSARAGVITSLDGNVTLRRQELQDLKEGGNLDAVVAAEVRAAEAQSLVEHLRVELDEANGRRASVEADLEKARLESASLERQLANLHKRLGDSEGQLRRGSPGRLTEEGGEKYKESPGFEMGLVQMGRVSLEYGYQLALARLQARHLGVEIELDPFVTLPEDADVPMADEQPFDDSLPPPEE
ncbi:hypothetical protein BHE74_00056475 [Ensete ventricosum]|nr:hypothetical protein BHE74_00056475 [Ensete ventricosum]